MFWLIVASDLWCVKLITVHFLSRRLLFYTNSFLKLVRLTGSAEKLFVNWRIKMSSSKFLSHQLMYCILTLAPDYRLQELKGANPLILLAVEDGASWPACDLRQVAVGCWSRAATLPPPGAAGKQADPLPHPPGTGWPSPAAGCPAWTGSWGVYNGRGEHWGSTGSWS
jgi:hypothetical protein